MTPPCGASSTGVARVPRAMRAPDSCVHQETVVQGSPAICDILAINVGILRKSGFQGADSRKCQTPLDLADNVPLPLVAGSGQAPVQLIRGANQGEVGKRLGKVPQVFAAWAQLLGVEA